MHTAIGCRILNKEGNIVNAVYAETCASIGMIFFAQRMLQNEPKSRYGDVMERALYNTVLAGMSRDGKSFFYVNPLEVNPKICDYNENYAHIKPERQRWFGCACCPPNVARLIASLSKYIYTIREDVVYTNLYIGGRAEFEVYGKKVVLTQESNYPWDGYIKFKVEADEDVDFTLALRIPEWCSKFGMAVLGDLVKNEGVENGFLKIAGTWKNGDEVEFDLAMPVLKVKGHPLIRHTYGKVALQRGPLVYCIEEADNGAHLHQLEINTGQEFEVWEDSNFIEGMVVILGVADKVKMDQWGDSLYRYQTNSEKEQVPIKFIPYFAWANRGLGEMQVWVNEEKGT